MDRRSFMQTSQTSFVILAWKKNENNKLNGFFNNLSMPVRIYLH